MTQRINPTPKLQARIDREPDLVDRIFEYLLAEFPQIAGVKLDATKSAVREEFQGEKVWVAARPASERQKLAAEAMALFNGRNATEVARRLNVSRATVYRLIKQPGAR